MKSPSTTRPRLWAVAAIYSREMRDQLRDRRTLFTIILLPMMLYPIVGMLLMQIAQFTRQHPTRVAVVGIEYVTNSTTGLRPVDGEIGIRPVTATNDRPEAYPTLLRPDSADPDRYQFTPMGEAGTLADSMMTIDGFAADSSIQTATRWVQSGAYDVVMFVDGPVRGPGMIRDQPTMQLLYNIGSDPSRIAKDRVTAQIGQWRGEWVRRGLVGAGIDLRVLDPFAIEPVDVAPRATAQAAYWSKLLPFIMLVWAMTGAFYPAIDLVAGEKERGTLETLLCSPATRSEIVWGKLAAVMTFSMSTAILNAGSMLITSSLVVRQMTASLDGLGGMVAGAPPLAPMAWLLVALIPLSMLFSALALAVAAMAKSSKEGQYYLMPLMMLTLPLVLLPMLPGTTLSYGTAMIPVTGMFLMVRALVEGHYGFALQHLPIVAMVTLLCLSVATRWARRQFESESVLFGGNDQWELSAWLRHLWRDRQTAATAVMATACGVIILVALFFAKLMVTSMPTTMGGIASLILLPQLGLILAPTLLMATMLTTSLRTSLRLRAVPRNVWPWVLALSVMLHPLYVTLASAVLHLYPMSDEASAAIGPFAEQIAAAPWTKILLLMAVVPAICEELAFRGFIFGGLVRGRHAVRAVLVTAIMFGVSHGVLQQSISATIMGVLLGWISLRTGSVLPTILIHVVNNSLSVSMDRLLGLEWPLLERLIRITDAGPSYHPAWTIGCVVGVGICLLQIHRATDDGDLVAATDMDADRVGLGRTVDPALQSAGAIT